MLRSLTRDIMEFKISFVAKVDSSRREPRMVRPASSLSSVPSTKPKKTGGLRSLFGNNSSPKKPTTATLSTPATYEPVEAFVQSLSANGTFGCSALKLVDLRPQCVGKVAHLSVAVRSPARGGKVVGQLALKAFYLPTLENISSEKLPKSLDECETGMAAASLGAGVHHSGVLTQLGFDCTVRCELVSAS